jgi:hypothetical protein
MNEQNELIMVQAECYRLNRYSAELKSFLEAAMNKCGATTLAELMAVIPEKQTGENE